MTEQPPQAPKKNRELTVHEETRVDPWYWLRDLEDPDTLEYLKAENAYTESVMKPWEGLQEKLYSEMRGRIKEDDSTVPAKEGEYFYYTRFEEGGQYPIYCRKFQTLDATEEVLLDVNQLADGQDYTEMGVVENSPDHQWLAYSVDNDGSEQYTIRVKNLETGQLLDEAISNSYYSLEWANDSLTFFYDVLDEQHRPVQVFRHRLRDDPAGDVLVYQETDPRFFVGIGKSASDRFIYVISGGNNITEWHYLDANQPEGNLTLIEPRHEEFEYDVEDHGERFLIRNNGDGAKDFKISETAIDCPAREHWQDLLPHQAGRPIQGMLLFQNHLAIAYRQGGLPQVQVQDLSTGRSHIIEFQEEDYSVRIQPGREWATSTLRFNYASLTTPSTVYDYDMETRERQFKKQTEVLGGFDSQNYLSRRVEARAPDGAVVPISLLFRKDTPLDGSAPLYLYGYGSYGMVMESEFGSGRLSLVDRGFIFAVAHLRGGMELGWDWYEGGKLLQKMNTFTDYIACAEHLIGEGYTTKGNIVAAGGSAGGVLMGAVANLRPDLFGAIVAQVPFVDVLNTMLDDTLPLTTMEYNEWGNPNERGFYDYIKTYSPYDNVRPQAYPPMLITGGISDPRVTYWEPAKWTARLRDTKTDDNLLLLKIHMESGHAGASGRFDRLKEVAEEFAFILNTVGMGDS